MMYVVCDFWAKSKLQKYLEPVVALMEKADKRAFLNSNELECFEVLLKRELGAQRSASSAKGEPYFFFHHPDLGSYGQIQLYDRKDAQYCVARLSFFELKGILEYDLNACDFFDVSDRLFGREGGVEHDG
ncbi:MAG: hypothetical protein IJT97_11330 [Bacteroidaceae bacterium]|nr:hypothetical protein [Bacteroidaceae bacterium]